MDKVDASVLAERRSGGMSWAEVGEPYGISADQARLRVRRHLQSIGHDPHKREQVSFQRNADGSATAMVTNSRRIRTVDQLLEACEVDLAEWEVLEARVGFHEALIKNADSEKETEALFNGRARLKPVLELVRAREAFDTLRADMLKHSPRYRPATYRPVKGEAHLFEMCLMDLHIGMYAWLEETGADYDSNIARELAAEAVASLVDKVKGFPINRCVVPLGNDLAHADRTIGGAGGSTQKGTPLDVDTRRARMVRMVRTVAVETIDALRLIAPTDVIIVPGNHDWDLAFSLGEVVAGWYRNDPNVTVNNAATSRKYYPYGTTLIGYTHGNREKRSDLPLLMAQEVPDLWAQATHKEWHLGHRHRKGETVAEFAGVRMRDMPSLAARDAWHAHQGYLHMRAAEAYLWGERTGYVGHFSTGVPDRLKEAA